MTDDRGCMTQSVKRGPGDQLAERDRRVTGCTSYEAGLRFTSCVKGRPREAGPPSCPARSLAPCRPPPPGSPSLS
eukprot:1296025-Pyramimonas_sp.AAC.2